MLSSIIDSGLHTSDLCQSSKKGLLEIKKVLEQGPSSKIAIKTPHLFLVQDDIAIAVKLIDAQFPPYEQVIPKEHKKIITVDRLRFVDALRRAQLMSSETRGVKVAATREGITITSDNPDLGEVREELEAEYNAEQENRQVAVRSSQDGELCGLPRQHRRAELAL